MTEEIKKILKSHGEQLDLIALKVVDHDEQLQLIADKMATRDDISNISKTLDKIVKLVERKDQELTFVTHDIKSFDSRIEKIENDVKKLKPALGLS